MNERYTLISGIIENLSSRAWRGTKYDQPGQFFVEPSSIATSTDPESLLLALKQLYEHARRWAPGLSVPYFVPPVYIVAETAADAGHFSVDEESYASVAISSRYIDRIDAVRLVLAHEACHNILMQSGLSNRSDMWLDEVTTDLAMFVCGFGDIVRRGHTTVQLTHNSSISAHLGYLNSKEYDYAYKQVLSLRTSEGLPGVPHKDWFQRKYGRVNATAIALSLIRRLMKRRRNLVDNEELLLEQILEEAQERKRRS